MICPVDLTVRSMLDGERSWVIDSWKRSYCKSWDALTYPSFDVFMGDYAPVIVDLIERAPVVVAHLKDEPLAAVAWACLDGDTLHYAYVKRRWRQVGVCRWFMGQLGLLDRPIEYTHRTRLCEREHKNGIRIEAAVEIPKSWQYRRFKAWRKAS
jgi:hypothetical protein